MVHDSPGVGARVGEGLLRVLGAGACLLRTRGASSPVRFALTARMRMARLSRLPLPVKSTRQDVDNAFKFKNFRLN